MFILEKLKTLLFFAKKGIYIWKEKKGNQRNTKVSKDSTISHVTYYVIGNAGDTALSQCVRRFFENNSDKINWNLIRVNSKVTEKVVQKINRTKALVIGGGGLFIPDTNANVTSGWQWDIAPELLKSIKVPIIVYSVGYNYFKGQVCNQLFQTNLELLCMQAEFIGLRNTGSILEVKKLLPENLRNKIIYQPCMTTMIRKIYGSIIPAKQSGRKIAFNIAFDREKSRFGNFEEEILYGIAHAAKMIEERGYEIFLVYHVASDAKAKKYMDAVGVKYKEMNLINAFPHQIYLFYNQIELVLGMRGHAQMIPFGLNCEILSLVSHDKMKWFLEDINATDWQIDLMKEHEQLAQVIYEKFVQVHENESVLTKKRLIEEQEKLWQISQENMKKIKEIINS